MCHPGLIIRQSCYFAIEWTRSRCVICVSCSVHAISCKTCAKDHRLFSHKSARSENPITWRLIAGKKPGNETGVVSQPRPRPHVQSLWDSCKVVADYISSKCSSAGLLLRKEIFLQDSLHSRRIISFTFASVSPLLQDSFSSRLSIRSWWLFGLGSLRTRCYISFSQWQFISLSLSKTLIRKVKTKKRENLLSRNKKIKNK